MATITRRPKEPIIERASDKTYWFCDWCNFDYRLDATDPRQYNLDLSRKSMTFTCPECKLNSALTFTDDLWRKIGIL